MSGEGRASGSVGPSRARQRRRAIYGAAAIPLLLGLVMGGLALGQRSLIYLPGGDPPPEAADLFDRAEDVTVRTEDGLALAAYLVHPAPEQDRNVAVLVAPGNAGNRADRAGVARHLADRGFTVLLLEYRGFGGNPGSPSEEGLHLDAVAAVSHLEQAGFGRDRVIYFGESLGTGVVAGLLADHPPAGVVLRSPFTDLPSVADRTIPVLPVGWMVWDRFPVREQVAASDVPVTVLRGSADEVVPTELSAEVAASASTLVEEVVFAGATHNDAIMTGPEVADAVLRLAVQAGLATQPSPP